MTTSAVLQRDCHASFAEPLSARNDKGDGCHCEEPCDEAILQSSTPETASAVLLQRALCFYSEIATPRSQSLSRLAMTKGTVVIARSPATKQSCSPQRQRQRALCYSEIATPRSQSLTRLAMTKGTVVIARSPATKQSRRLGRLWTASAVLLQRALCFYSERCATTARLPRLVRRASLGSQ